MWINKIKCFFGNHKYRLKRIISNNTREIYCCNCKKEFGMNDNLRVVIPLDDELKKFNDDLLEYQNKS